MKTLTVLLVLLAAPALANDCRPFVFTADSIPGNSAGALPGTLANWQQYREVMLGIPAEDLGEGGFAPVFWRDLPGIGFPYVDPDWTNVAGLVSRLRGEEEWEPSCSWERTKEWLVATVCGDSNPLYAECRREPGACAILSATSTWARKQTCDGGKCRWDCVGYASVKAADIQY